MLRQTNERVNLQKKNNQPTESQKIIMAAWNERENVNWMLIEKIIKKFKK